MVARLKELLSTKKLVKVFGLGQLLSHKFIEIVAMHGGFDAVWLDNEHSGVTIEQIELAALAARACGLDSFVRLAPTDYASIMRPLEAGSGGIMAAQVRSAAQTEQIVQWAKFYPRGLRGFNGLGVDGRYGSMPSAEYSAKANRETFVAIQIEHADAVADIDRIAAVPDVDLLFIGPADLSQSMGLLGDWEHPQLWASIEKVGQASKRHNVPWAILPKDAAYARRCVELGCRCLSIGFDVWAVHLGVKATKSQFADFFSSESPQR
jgi:2-dehydro-3-deoxyglucarate aldolase/4-hydroxy-2-oxoheptanedioate aldolase